MNRENCKNEESVKKIIPIVFSANAKYAPYISVTITSIVKNSSDEFFYKFYVFYTELSDSTILRLEDIRGDFYDTTCINVEDLCTPGMYTAAYFSKEMYFRIMIPEIFPEYDKVLYLDCDVVVLKDISELYFNDIGENLIGAVRNLMHEKMKKYIRFSLLIDADKYINSGIILFNSKKCREEEFTKNAFELLEKRQDFRYPDQDLINMMCQDKIFYLDARWNFTWHYRHLQESKNEELHLCEADMVEFLECEKNPFILHYTGEIKPWNNVNKYLSDYFWLYAKDSNFYNLFLNRLINENVSSAKDSDNQNKLKTLENKVNELTRLVNFDGGPNTDTFNKVVSEKEEYLTKYNEVIGSKSYKLGRFLTFPFRKPVDFFKSIKKNGFKKTMKLIPVKFKLYFSIIFGRR